MESFPAPHLGDDYDDDDDDDDNDWPYSRSDRFIPGENGPQYPLCIKVSWP
jgi:hypothetical protein